MNTVWAALPLLIVMLYAPSAWAQDRTFCVEFGFLDERERCPGATGVPTSGARTQCNPGGFSYAQGFLFEVWDRDTLDDPSTDDFIGEWRATAAGENCATFSWSDTSDNPDLYIVMRPRGKGTGVTALLRGMQNTGTASSPNWQEYIGSSTRNHSGTYINCLAGTTCRIGPGVRYIPNSTPTSDLNGVYAAIESALRPYRVYSSQINSTATVQLEIDDLSQWPSSEQCSAACAPSRTKIRADFDGDTHLDGDRLSHEIGHVVQMSEFGQDALRVDCGGSWAIDGAETWDSCAATEGWASYVGVLGWYDPAVTTAAPTYAGEDIEAATVIDTSSCGANRRIPGQVAKGFWDLDDANNEAGVGLTVPDDDSKNSSTNDILNAWDNFPDGTGNGDDFESDSDGVNLWDFTLNTWGGDGGLPYGPFVNYEALMHHNCTESQTTL